MALREISDQEFFGAAQPKPKLREISDEEFFATAPTTPVPAATPTAQPESASWLPERSLLAIEKGLANAAQSVYDYTGNKESGIVGRTVGQAATGLMDSAQQGIGMFGAGATQDKITAIQRAQALPDDFTEPDTPGVGSMGGYSMPTKGRNKAQILAQAYADAGITPEQLPQLRQQAVSSVENADKAAALSGQREQIQQDIDAYQGIPNWQGQARSTIASGLQSAVMMAPAVPVSMLAPAVAAPALAFSAALAPGVTQTMVEAENKSKDSDMSALGRGSYIAAQGAAEIIPELIPGGFEKMLATPAKKIAEKGIRAALKAYGYNNLMEVPQELSTLLTQKFTDKYSGVDPKAFDNIGQDMASTVASTLATGAMVGGKSVATGLKETVTGQAKKQKKIFDDLRARGLTDEQIAAAQQGDPDALQKIADSGVAAEATAGLQELAAQLRAQAEPPSPIPAIP